METWIKSSCQFIFIYMQNSNIQPSSGTILNSYKCNFHCYFFRFNQRRTGRLFHNLRCETLGNVQQQSRRLPLNHGFNPKSSKNLLFKPNGWYFGICSAIGMIIILLQTKRNLFYTNKYFFLGDSLRFRFATQNSWDPLYRPRTPHHTTIGSFQPPNQTLCRIFERDFRKRHWKNNGAIGSRKKFCFGTSSTKYAPRVRGGCQRVGEETEERVGEVEKGEFVAVCYKRFGTGVGYSVEVERNEKVDFCEEVCCYFFLFK